MLLVVHTGVQAQSDQDLDDDVGLLPDFKSLSDKSLKSRINFDSILKKPVDGGVTSSPFGWRDHPLLHERRFHTGVDYAVPVGTPVHAAQAGKVIFIGTQGGYGKLLVIQHNTEYKTYYAHLSAFAKGLAEGSRVSSGDVVAYTGNTGLSTGPHIHFEIRRYGKPVNPVTGTSAPSKILVNKGYIQKIPYGKTTRTRQGRYRTILK